MFDCVLFTLNTNERPRLSVESIKVYDKNINKWKRLKFSLGFLSTQWRTFKLKNLRVVASRIYNQRCTVVACKFRLIEKLLPFRRKQATLYDVICVTSTLVSDVSRRLRVINRFLFSPTAVHPPELFLRRAFAKQKHTKAKNRYVGSEFYDVSLETSTVIKSRFLFKFHPSSFPRSLFLSSLDDKLFRQTFSPKSTQEQEKFYRSTYSSN